MFDKTKKLPIKTVIFEEISSTNDYCKANDNNEDMLVIALSQTNGKGRMGRTFFSPVNKGIYFSLLLHPEFSTEKIHYFTPLAAVSVLHAIEKIRNKNCLIKWVNDIYIDDKKVCGILTEASFNSNGKIKNIVCGIGVNLFSDENTFPDEIKEKAGSVFSGEGDFLKIADSIVYETVNNIIMYYENFEDLPFLGEYRKKSYLDGKEVSFVYENKTVSGKVKEIDENAKLTVVSDNGKIYNLNSGEVSVIIKKRK